VIEAHHLLEPAGQVVKQRLQVPVRDDGFRNREQCMVLLAGGKHVSVSWRLTHDESYSD
jgi:hypothetical protein